ncbi:MAG TPA: hypothetical protein VNW90_03565 [Acetobacteraceae bacterium]|nr:hypothetical protein [Acetobacteraceae bacterium]
MHEGHMPEQPSRRALLQDINLRLSCQERITEDFEASGILLATGTAEGVNRRPDHNIDESDRFQQLLPGCTRQTASNSSCPKIDVADHSFRHRSAVGNVRKL